MSSNLTENGSTVGRPHVADPVRLVSQHRHEVPLALEVSDDSGKDNRLARSPSHDFKRHYAVRSDASRGQLSLYAVEQTAKRVRTPASVKPSTNSLNCVHGFPRSPIVRLRQRQEQLLHALEIGALVLTRALCGHTLLPAGRDDLEAGSVERAGNRSELGDTSAQSRPSSIIAMTPRIWPSARRRRRTTSPTVSDATCIVDSPNATNAPGLFARSAE